MVSISKTTSLAAVAASQLAMLLVNPPLMAAPAQTQAKAPALVLTGDELLVQRGLDFARHSQKERANLEFRKIKDLDKIPDLSAIYVAENFIKVSKLEVAKKMLDRVLEHPTMKIGDTDKAYAYRTRAIADTGLGDTSAAIRDYKLAADSDKRLRSEDLAKAAQLLSKEKKYDEALKLLDASIKASGTPGDPADYFYRGNCLQSMGRDKDAVRDFSTSLSITEGRKKKKPSSEDMFRTSYLLAARAKSYEKLGEKELAAADRKKQEDMCDPLDSTLFSRSKYASQAHAEVPPLP